MKQLVTPENHTVANIFALPTCSRCGHAMRLLALEPHIKFRSLDIQKFGCECGASLTVSVARIE